MAITTIILILTVFCEMGMCWRAVGSLRTPLSCPGPHPCCLAVCLHACHAPIFSERVFPAGV
ncbi:unnamed protein product [Nyctereutes procyonoides]|uniref:(raccoon dog) hypothetical protein n=1 Tax=Nyctereutes procyonoides TaxID=34880 RepID=A0A811YT85_NYCPR|nr:unnamed protein product [Nyctereutes procyonoides]